MGEEHATVSTPATTAPPPDGQWPDGPDSWRLWWMGLLRGTLGAFLFLVGGLGSREVIDASYVEPWIARRDSHVPLVYHVNSLHLAGGLNAREIVCVVVGLVLLTRIRRSTWIIRTDAGLIAAAVLFALVHWFAIRWARAALLYDYAGNPVACASSGRTPLNLALTCIHLPALVLAATMVIVAVVLPTRPWWQRLLIPLGTYAAAILIMWPIWTTRVWPLIAPAAP